MNITGSTAVYGIIGKPIEHTLSPKIHNFMADELKINEVYVPFVANDDLKSIAAGLYALGVKGINVTVPYKTDIMKELVGIDPLAKAIGAVNTLKYVDGGYYGYNTDILGLGRELDDEGVSLEGKDVIMLGAGGAARAVAFLCASRRAASITIVNRTLARGEAIKTDVIAYATDNGMSELANNIKVIELSRICELDKAEYIVFQCTNVGLSPNDTECIVDDKTFYSKVSVGVDLIYKPSETMFMKHVQEAGGRAYNGLKMLIYQAICAQEIWNDIEISDSVAEAIERELS